MKKYVIAIITVFLLAVGIVAISEGCKAGVGGDGESSCKICGRSSVFAYGYCEGCFNSYMDWREDNGY